MFGRLIEARITPPQAKVDQTLMAEIEKKMSRFLQEAKRLSGGNEAELTIVQEIRRKLEAILYLPIITSRYPRIRPKGVKAAAEYLHKELTDSTYQRATLFGWLFVHALGKVVAPGGFARQGHTWIDEWRLGKTIFHVLRELGLEETAARNSVTVIKWLTDHQTWFEEKPSDQKQAYATLESLLRDNDVQEFLRINHYNDVWWYNKEAFEEMLWWLMMVAALTIGSDSLRSVNAVVEDIQRCYAMIQIWQKSGEKSEYQVEKLLERVREAKSLTP
jgi:hypothetical protein